MATIRIGSDGHERHAAREAKAMKAKAPPSTKKQVVDVGFAHQASLVDRLEPRRPLYRRA